MHPEKALFAAFVVPARRRRYIELLDTKGGRKKILRSLDHFKDLDPRFCRKVKSADVLRVLLSLGAPPTCHVISSSARLDGREPLKNIIGSGQGALISCVPGKLAYFESEEPGERYVCYVGAGFKRFKPALGATQ